jgi:hypothetical protein
MSLTIDLIGSLWAQVGPGLILAAALPFMLVAFGIVVRTGYKKVRVTR